MPVVSSLARRFSGGDGAPLSLLVYVAEVLKAAQEHRHSVWGAVERQRVAHVAAVTDALRLLHFALCTAPTTLRAASVSEVVVRPVVAVAVVAPAPTSLTVCGLPRTSIRRRANDTIVCTAGCGAMLIVSGRVMASR